MEEALELRTAGRTAANVAERYVWLIIHDIISRQSNDRLSTILVFFWMAKTSKKIDLDFFFLSEED